MKAQAAQPTEKPSRAKLTFDDSIRDAEKLLKLCEPTDVSQDDCDVYKRAGLVMAMTAWETYVEDRVQEGVEHRVAQDRGFAAEFMLGRLREELKRLNNPSWERTKKLFKDYLQIDVTAHWNWSGYGRERATETLNSLLEMRGTVVHRSTPRSVGQPLAAYR